MATVVIAVCVGALVVQRSLADLAEKQVHDLAHGLGKNMLILPDALNPSSFYRLDPGDTTMPEETVSRIVDSPAGQHVQQMSVELVGHVPGQIGEQLIVGVRGLFPGESDQSWAPALLGSAAADRLGVGDGDQFDLGGQPLQVAKVAPSLPIGYENAVIVELEVAQVVLNQPGRITAIRAGGCWCSMDIPALARTVEANVPGVRAFTRDGVVKAQKGSIQETARFSKPLLAIAFALTFAAVALLMTSQVRRQTREIGLLMAIGAKPGAVTVGFLWLAATIGLIGAGAGFLISSPLGQITGGLILGEPPVEPFTLDGRLLAGAVLVSILAAAVPAIRASNIDPTTALREF